MPRQKLSPKAPRIEPPPTREGDVVVNTNQLIADLQHGVRHTTEGSFTFSLEHAQGRDKTYFWRAFVLTHGVVRATSKEFHQEPGAAIAELWDTLKEKG